MHGGVCAAEKGAAVRLFESQDRVGGRTSQVRREGLNLGSGELSLMGGIQTKGLAVSLIVLDDSIDTALKFFDRLEGGAVERFAGEDREPDFCLVQPRVRVGVAWKCTFLCLASHVSRFGLWVERLSRTTWISWFG